MIKPIKPLFKPKRSLIPKRFVIKSSAKIVPKKTFKEQIESVPNRTKHEIFGYKKPRGRFINKTQNATEFTVRFNEKHKYTTGKYSEIHTHLCNPKIPFESVPSPHDFVGWIDDYITTNGKKNRAVVSSVHFKSGKELGRVHVLVKKDALNNQLRKHIYTVYADFAKKNNRTITPFERFNADLYFLQESGKVRRYLKQKIDYDFDFEKRMKSSKLTLKEIFIDVEKKWGVKVRAFSHPGQNFDYISGSFL